MKQHVTKLKKFAVNVCKKYPLRIFLSGVLIGSIIAFSWHYTNRIIPAVQAGEGEAINPELRSDKKPDIQDIQAIQDEGPKDDKLTIDEVKQERYARNVSKISMDEGLQRVPRSPKVQSKTFYSYSQTALYEIFCHEGYLTDIQLQPGEDILYIGGGDTVRWIVDRAQSGSGDNKRWHIYIKPLKGGIMTNFMITTDRRAYQIRARATADFYNPIVGWNYPLDDKAAFLRTQEEKMKKEEEEVSKAVAPDKMNFAYTVKEKSGWFGGSYSWTPKIVFDDGAKTYIQMSSGMATGEAPALFVKDTSGEVMLVNYRVKNNYYIVDRLFTQAEMRNGMKETVVITRNVQ
jgi:type IV secretion system protein TrbG